MSVMLLRQAEREVLRVQANREELVEQIAGACTFFMRDRPGQQGGAFR